MARVATRAGARIAITESEIIAELRRAASALPKSPKDAYTAEDLAAAAGIEYKRMLRTLKPLVLAGQVEVVPLRRRRIDGRPCSVPGYRFVGKKRGR